MQALQKFYCRGRQCSHKLIKEEGKYIYVKKLDSSTVTKKMKRDAWEIVFVAMDKIILTDADGKEERGKKNI